MPFNGSGGTTQPAGSIYPATANTLIESAKANTSIADLYTMLAGVICKDGQTTITANIPLSGYKLTGVGAATARTDAATLASIQDGTGVYVATVGGTADVITLTVSPVITAYAAGQTFRFIASGANTTNVTVNVSALGAKAITKNGATALVAGDIPAGYMVQITYDGTRFILGSIGASGIPLTIIDAAGDLIQGSAADTAARLAIGTAGQLLRVNAGATAAEWGAGLVASTTVVGNVELLTQAEYDAGTDTTRAPTASLNRIALGTEQASTAGTSIDFTGIPAGTRRIVISLVGVSTNGTAIVRCQIGDSGGVETAGYLGASDNGVVTNNTTYFGVEDGANAAAVRHGSLTLNLENASAFTWSCTGIVGRSDTNSITTSAGTKSLSAELDRVRITANGVDTFDLGAINIQYER